ncbi:MAG: hypothetical protein JWP32_2867 [Schumannella sp.]|nr:hypothetical protein [Schumannella sp.]
MRLYLYGGMLGAAEFALDDEIEISDALAAGYRIHQADDGFIHGTPMMRCRWSAWVGKPVLPHPEWPDYADARLESPPSPPVIISPECTAGKHDACNGDAWDTVRDAVTDCPCTCHAPNGDSDD